VTGAATGLVAVRAAVRRFLDAAAAGRDLERAPGCDVVAVACSGGADSLALAEAAVHHGRFAVHGLVVDHGLQPGSDAVAAAAVDQLTALGCAKAQVLAVDIRATSNVEAAARTARYAALAAARPHPRALVLLGHTLDDQAETVLLGLGRGSGPRSIAGMRELDPPWGRPLLGVRRADTGAACAELGLTPWEDPHNADPRFRRARLRAEVLPLLEDVLGGGVAPALARTAAQLREDCQTLDALAAELLTSALHEAREAREARDDEDAPLPRLERHDVTSSLERPSLERRAVDAAVLAAAPVGVRRRAIRRWLLAAGVSGLTDAQLRSVDALVDPARWRGQGAVALPGRLEASRSAGRLWLRPHPGPLHHRP
jgi:tRNA(Ile)-lysidine synthase